MKYFDWNDEKNEWLKTHRGIGFEDIVIEISNGNLLDLLVHLNKEKYPNQKILYVEKDDYVYTVPYVEDKEKVFLKIIIPDRKATKKYLRK